MIDSFRYNVGDIVIVNRNVKKSADFYHHLIGFIGIIFRKAPSGLGYLLRDVKTGEKLNGFLFDDSELDLVKGLRSHRIGRFYA